MKHINTVKEYSHTIKITHDEAILIAAAIGSIGGHGYWRKLATHIYEELQESCEVEFSEYIKLLDGDLTLTETERK
jgi:hypothetical protein